MNTGKAIVTMSIAIASAAGATGAAPFAIEAGARIVVAAGEPECVLLAARDLAADIKSVGGIGLAVAVGETPSRGDLFIRTSPDGGAPESHSVSVADGVLVFTGADARGTMFAIYDFIETRLGIDPLAWWNGAPPPRMERLAWDDVSIKCGAPRFRYRGWFVNDEDLLTGWRPSGAKRNIDYPYYSDVVDPGVIDRIAEALLRCRGNLIIPASFLDLSNPGEAALADRCARRGLILSQHHVEPLGTSAFTFFDYWRKRGREARFSYFSNPDEMEEVWREMARRWAGYPEVIWQLGLRGIADRPMWGADPAVPADDASRGKIISRAIARQVGILDEIGVPREGRVMTMTLWSEGAALYRKGLLEVPEGVIVAAADNTPGWSWSPPLREIKREPGRAYGVYYHHALISPGPHLASLVPPTRTYAMLAEAARGGFDSYAICNVSNVREFTRDLSATSKMLWDPMRFDPGEWQEDWIARHFPTDSRAKWAALFRDYDSALELDPESGAPLFLDGLLQKLSRRTADALENTIASMPAANGGDPGGDLAVLRLRLVAQAARYAEIEAMMEPLFEALPSKCSEFADTTIRNPTRMMHTLTEWAGELVAAQIALEEGRRADAAKHADAALAAIGRANGLSSTYCVGRWENWYRDCRKINLAQGLERTRKIRDALNGE